MKLLYITAFIVGLISLTPKTVLASNPQGEVLYTQVNIHSFKNKVVTWKNYSVDALIPVNTAIIIKPHTGKKVYFAIKDSKTRLVFKNSIASGLTGKEWLAKHAAKSKVNMDKFTPLERECIKNATILLGMRKSAVIVARGFPPLSLTSDLTSSTWTYWINRIDKEEIRFINDKVSQILMHTAPQ